MSPAGPSRRRTGPAAREPAADKGAPASKRRRPVSRIGTPDRASAKAIARVGQVLDHPLRVQILSALVRGSNSAIGLAPDLEVPLGSVSYHLNQILDRRFGVVEVVEVNQRRGAEETVYRIAPDALLGELDWPEDSGAAAAGLQGAALLAFCQQTLAAIRRGSIDARPGSLASWRPAAVDEAGWEEISSAMQDASARVAEAVRASAERGGASIETVVGLAAFQAAPFPEPLDGTREAAE